MMHLDPRTYAALLAGTLPPEEARALSGHLAGDCERCERFLAERGSADALDGAADAAIDRAFPPRGLPSDDLAFARLRRRLRPGPARPRSSLALGALAATLLAFGLTRLLHQPKPDSAWDGVKGAATHAPELHLRYVLLGAGGETARGGSGDTVPREASLLFELESGSGVEAALARVSPEGRVEIVWRDRIASGRTVLGSAGRASAYPLAGLSGRQRFVLVAGDGPLDPGRVERVVAALVDGGRPAAPGGLSYDIVEVTVR